MAERRAHVRDSSPPSTEAGAPEEGPRDRRGGGEGRGEGNGRAERAPLQLERLIHERMRLGIVSALAVNETLTFKDLRSLLRTSDGNLSVHARKLEDAGYVTCEKTFKGRVPRTVFRLTSDGRTALERYLGHMEAIIHATRGS